MKTKNVILGFVLGMGALVVQAEDKKVEDWGLKYGAEKKADYSLNVFGFSHHEKEDARSHLHGEHPGVGVKIWIDYTFLGGRPYLESDFIFKNSKKGTMFTIGPGIEWTLHQVEDRRLLGGVIASRVRYQDPPRNAVYWGNVPGLRIGMGWKTHSAHFTGFPKGLVTLNYSYDFW